MTTQILIEQLDLTEVQTDVDNRVLRNVVLIRAGMSKNKRFYSDDVLAKSVPVFEGAKAFLDHGKGSRSVRDIAGYYRNVAYKDGKLVADRYFTKTLAGNDAWAIAEEIVSGRAPASLAGLSINAVGTARKHPADDTAIEVESITAALSVDDVSEAAAGGAYRESYEDLGRRFLDALSFEEYFEARPDYIKRIQHEMKTARQDEALKVATAKAESAEAALQEAQNTIATLQAERDAALAEHAAARLDLALESTLNKVNLPAEWRASLRETLLKTEQSEWAALIEREQQKARSAGHRTPVSGAGQQVSQPLEYAAPSTGKQPYDMSRINSPEDLVKVLRSQS